jgi:hypothetical protein
MRSLSLLFAGIAFALVPVAQADAQTTDQNVRTPVRHEKRILRQAKVQVPLLIYCKRNIPCRPVRKGCHLEQELNGWNEEVCN